MKLLKLNGESFSFTSKASEFPLKPKELCRSNIQYECGQLLKKLFPSESILEDVPLPDGFYLDFFIGSRKLAIEVQGRQHDEYVPFFHKNKKGFIASQTRDYNKEQWCDLNGIILYKVKDKEDLIKCLK